MQPKPNSAEAKLIRDVEAGHNRNQTQPRSKTASTKTKRSRGPNVEGTRPIFGGVQEDQVDQGWGHTFKGRWSTQNRLEKIREIMQQGKLEYSNQKQTNLQKQPNGIRIAKTGRLEVRIAKRKQTQEELGTHQITDKNIYQISPTYCRGRERMSSPGNPLVASSTRVSVSSLQMWLFHREEKCRCSPINTKTQFTLAAHSSPFPHSSGPLTPCHTSRVSFDLAITNNRQHNVTKKSSQNIPSHQSWSSTSQKLSLLDSRCFLGVAYFIDIVQRRKRQSLTL